MLQLSRFSNEKIYNLSETGSGAHSVKACEQTPESLRMQAAHQAVKAEKSNPVHAGVTEQGSDERNHQ